MLSAKHNKQARAGKVSSLVAAFIVVLCPPGGAAAGADGIALPPAMSEADFLPFDERRAALGRLLFYDPILSGNHNISCGTCHHHSLASADGLALGVGEGGEGIGEKRTTGDGRDRIDRRVPRNAPALFNIGHKDIPHLFHDGRLSIDDLYGNGFNSPAEEYLPRGLNSLAAAQSLFPVTSETEMAGHSEENAVAGARNDRIDHAWRLIAKRIRAVPGYGTLFVEAFPDVESPADITIVHMGNALGDFVNSEWRSHDSALTAPHGHNGAYATLEGIIRHHLDPQGSFDRWNRSQVALPAAEHLKEADFAALQDRRERERVRAAVDIEPLDLSDDEVRQLVAFLHALTGEESVKGRLGRPDEVPSGLPVD